MAENVKPEVIKLTQDLLGKYFKKPPLTEKLLKKPPFRFLHDVITAVIKETGFLDGLFNEEEMNSENIKDKDAKLAYLTKLIAVVKLISDDNLTVRASKIISGQEPTKTNELLQAIGKAIDNKVDSSTAIAQYNNKKKPVEKKGNEKAKEAGKTVSSKRTEPPKRSSSEEKKKSSSTKEPVKRQSSKEIVDRAKPKKEESRVSSSRRNGEKEMRLKKSESIKDEVELTRVIENGESEAQAENDEKTQETEENGKEESKNNEVVETMDQGKQASSASAKSRSERKSSSGSRKKSSSTRIREKTVDELQQVVESQEENGMESIKNKENLESTSKTEPVMDVINEEEKQPSVVQPPKELEQPTKPPAPLKESNAIDKEISQSRPKSLRPPTGRPPSARPAAPRLKSRMDFAINEDLITPAGMFNIAVDVYDEKEDAANDMVVLESNKNNFLDSAELDKTDDQAIQGHGHLVTQILETQRELINANNVEVTPKKSTIEWEAGTRREQESLIKEVDKLRGSIQILTRATNPMGKLFDFLQENLEIMKRELQDWQGQYKSLIKQLEEEKAKTQDSIEPMKKSLEEIENSVVAQWEKINQVKQNIVKNDQKINKLLSSEV